MTTNKSIITLNYGTDIIVSCFTEDIEEDCNKFMNVGRKISSEIYTLRRGSQSYISKRGKDNDLIFRAGRWLFWSVRNTLYSISIHIYLMADRGYKLVLQSKRTIGHSELEIHSCSSITKSDGIECKIVTIIVADLWRRKAQ